MASPRIILLRGRPTAGKSTAFKTLKEKKKLKNTFFIDHCKQKEDFGTEMGKKVLYNTLKTLMPEKKDIILEEMSRETLNKHIKREMKKYNYTFLVFQFTVDTNKAYKRDIERSKGKKPMGKKQIDEYHKMHDERFDKKGILIDTNTLNKEQVVKKIIRELKKGVHQ